MRPNTVRLEDSVGRVVESPSEDAVRGSVGAIGSSVDHCILDLGEAGFVQAAGSSGALIVEYRDGSGMYSSSGANLDTAAVQRIFVDAMNGRTEWKREFSFEPVATGGGTGDRAATDAGGGGGILSAFGGGGLGVGRRAGRRAPGARGGVGVGGRRVRGGSLSNEVARTVGSEARFGLRRFIRRIIRNLVRGRVR